ncbi:MAG: GMC family oxidoreductase [Cyanobacteria bacterium P01_H01_bin.105]
MILDFQDFPLGSHIECDICIVGAGAAGIALALELAKTSLDIVLLESGGRFTESDTQALYDSEVIGLTHSGIHQGRHRILGGSTVHWSGQSLPLEPIDFERRDWVPFSGWPLSRQELDPFYRQAEAVMHLDKYEYGQDAWQRLEIKPPEFEPNKIGSLVSKYTYKSNFFETYREQLQQLPSLRVLQHANAVQLVPNLAGKKMEEVQIRTLTGKTGTVRATTTIVCCGGIESARLLLASNQVCPAGLGNQHDLVGRFFQDHLDCYSAEIVTDSPRQLQRLYSWHRRRDSFYYPKIPLAETVQREKQVLNAIGDLVFQSSPDDGLFVLQSLLGKVQPSTETARRVQLKALIRDFPGLVFNAYQYGVLRHSPVSNRSRILLRCHSEQSPNPASRITLSDEKDVLGMPRAQLDWRLTDSCRETIHEFTKVVADEFSCLGLGEVKVFDWVSKAEEQWTENIWDTYHHMGTTRMADNSKTGVVDRNCQVHGVEGLYVVSSSVFPTSGSSNPTLTILALAMRLVDRLKRSQAT